MNMAEEITYAKKEFMTCRRILCFMIITCFMVHYMIRVNMSIAIVEMIEKNDSNATFPKQEKTFQWTEHQKNDVLGCFFWGFLITAIPGGRLSEIYGTRVILGAAMLIASLLTVITPFACYVHYYCVIAVRFALGLALGVSWPSIPPMAMKWVAPTDTAKFLSHTIACTLGAGLTLPICGYVIAYLGWPSVFYITGAISLLWTIFWFYLIYDSPAHHPRITNEEKYFIESETYRHNSKVKIKIPWIKILTSAPVWAIIVADTCLQFNTNIVLNELPSYMDKVLHYNIKENGFLSSLPFFATYIMAVIFTYIADSWRKSEKFSTLTIRKLFTTITFAVPCLLFVLQTLWGYNRMMSIAVFTLSQGFMAASTAGFMPNTMDISPPFSGTIFGLAFTGGASTGFISAKVVAYVTSEGVNFEQWRYIFLILIGINVVGGVFYYVFASAEIQSWNPKQSMFNEIELKELNSQNMRKDDEFQFS